MIIHALNTFYWLIGWLLINLALLAGESQHTLGQIDLIDW